MKMLSRSSSPTERSSWRCVPSPQSNSSRSPPRRISIAGRPRRALGTEPAVPAKNSDRSMGATVAAAGRGGVRGAQLLLELPPPEPGRVVAGTAFEAIAFVLALIPRSAVLASAKARVLAADDRRHVAATGGSRHRLRGARRASERKEERHGCSEGCWRCLAYPHARLGPHPSPTLRSTGGDDRRSKFVRLAVIQKLGFVGPVARARRPPVAGGRAQLWAEYGSSATTVESEVPPLDDGKS